MKFLILFILIFAVFSCATSPTGRKQLKYLPEGQMDSLGEQSFEKMKQKMAIDRSVGNNRYVNCVVKELLNANGFNASEWEVVVFKEKSANAFALPGKKIGVHSGILEIANEQSQLAAVLGHEIAHVVAEHGNERMSQALGVNVLLVAAQLFLEGKENPNSGLIMAALGIGAQVGVLMAYSRKHETESDIMGQQYMAKAGFNPQGAIDLWKKMAKNSQGAPPEFLSTHPSHDSRIKELSKGLSKYQKTYQKVVDKPSCRL